jgi:hypothetical protein
MITVKHSGNIGRIILNDIYWVIEGSKYNCCPLIFVSTSEIYGSRENKSYLKEEGILALSTDCKTEFIDQHPILGIDKEEFVKEIEKDFIILKREDNKFEREICLLLKKK